MYYNHIRYDYLFLTYINSSKNVQNIYIYEVENNYQSIYVQSCVIS